MNIFEQYGIKEVCDITLYSIELNKYGDEIYVPIMYFDTLKVSTLEQTGSQTAAKGGHGNVDQVIWDFGKEITLRIEDALYTPASQSLMWGGKFGTKKSKIYGVWNPYIYPTDEYGRTHYLKKRVFAQHGNWWMEEGDETLEQYDEEQLIEMGGIKFLCPCDNQIKIMVYEQNDGHYKYLKIDYTDDQADQLEGNTYVCPKNKIILASLNSGEALKKYRSSELVNSMWIDNKRPERAELSLDCFGSFKYTTYQYAQSEINENYCYYKEFADVDGAVGCEEVPDIYGYIWQDANLKMNSLEGDQKMYYIENTNVQFRVEAGTSQKEITLAQNGLFRKNEPLKEIYNFTKNDLRYNELTGIIEKTKDFQTKLDFYLNLEWELPNSDISTNSRKKITKVKIGTFYIIDDWNSQVCSPEELIYPIESGLKDVHVLDRMERVVAKNTFAIDTNRNLRMFNYSQMPEYENTELTVYFDPLTMKPYEPSTDHFVKRDGSVIEGSLRIIKQYDIYLKWTRSKAPKYTSLGHQIVVNSDSFPGAYRLVGETFSKRRDDGKNLRYQIDIPLCKMSSNTNLTLQAAGEPTTFSAEFKVLRKDNGEMVKLTQYEVENTKYEDTYSNSTSIVPVNSFEPEEIIYGDSPVFNSVSVNTLKETLLIISPEQDSMYTIPIDESDPYLGSAPYIVNTVATAENWDKTELNVEVSIEEGKLTVDYVDGNKIDETMETTSTSSENLNPSDYSTTMEVNENESV